MKAKSQFALNKYIVDGRAKRDGASYILNPWAIPEDEYEELVADLRKECVTSLCNDGVKFTPNTK